MKFIVGAVAVTPIVEVLQLWKMVLLILMSLVTKKKYLVILLLVQKSENAMVMKPRNLKIVL